MLPSYAATERAELLSAALAVLSERERIVVILRNQNRLARDVAKLLEISHVSVLDTEKRGLRKMRTYFESRGIAELTHIL